MKQVEMIYQGVEEIYLKGSTDHISVMLRLHVYKCHLCDNVVYSVKPLFYNAKCQNQSGYMEHK